MCSVWDVLSRKRLGDVRVEMSSGQQEVGLRRLKEILGLGRELWGSLAHSLAWTGTLSRCGEKKMGLDPNQGHHHVWNK